MLFDPVLAQSIPLPYKTIAQFFERINPIRPKMAKILSQFTPSSDHNHLAVVRNSDWPNDALRFSPLFGLVANLQLALFTDRFSHDC